MKTPKLIRVLSIFCWLIGFSYHANATRLQEAPSHWDIKPKVCVVENLSDICTLTINLNLINQALLTHNNIFEGNTFCVYKEQTQLLCFVVNRLSSQNTQKVEGEAQFQFDILALPEESPLNQTDATPTENGLNMSLSIEKESTLNLKNETNTVIYTQSISIKARQSGKKTRRIRDPWSLF